jgi:dTDP-4-amino-4,6-dideoxygalactose transaminase
VARFEEEYAAFQGARYGVTCTNGTAALEIALQACRVSQGDEVIVPPYTFIATASAVVRTGGTPVFADIELETANLDIEDVEAKLTDRTKAVLPVHFAGLPVDMDAYNALGREKGLAIIEDACHSWGTQWKGKGAGALGQCGAFSFQMSKNITAGEGGIMLTDDEGIADAARSVTNCGRCKSGGWYEHTLIGTNLRMTEIQAAILRVQLTRLEEQTIRREENARRLDARVRGIPGIRIIDWVDPRITRRSYHMYSFRFTAEEWPGVSRDRFVAAMQAEGVPVGAGYPYPLYKNPVFQRPELGRDYSDVSCPNAERMCQEACWIMHPALLGSPEDTDDIARAMEKVRDSAQALAE